VVQDTPASAMTFDLGYMIADLSRHMTLLPGDLILSGTPANSRPMVPGDKVEVEVTNVGRLVNTVAEAPRVAIDVGYAPNGSEEVRKVALGGDFFR
jgi:5-oxopent-3-ene-1,2,5-tricarboxylate decarboxylase / 2-hydroxyhepta-2,4-diene-1,7-dioate isomerase